METEDGQRAHVFLLDKAIQMDKIGKFKVSGQAITKVTFQSCRKKIVL